MSLQRFVESSRFERFVVAVIALNAVTLGLETVKTFSPETQAILLGLDRLFLAVFVVELILKLIVYRTKYFSDPWRIFDFVIISIALLPSSGPFSVLRSLRILRALRMLSIVPSLRKVVGGLLSAIPGLGAVGSIMALIFYVGAVMATKLFGEAFPDWFGSIPKSAFSLFQVMTLESWSMGMVRPILERFPYAWSFFIPFILITTFTMLNLFIAVIVTSLQSDSEAHADERAKKGHDERMLIIEELKQIRGELERLKRN